MRYLTRSVFVSRQGTALVWIAAVGLAVLGCGKGGGYQVVPVSGTVTIDGKPVANIAVVFQPIASGKTEPGPGSTGVTDAQGKYTLTVTSAQKQPGAVVGKHRVTFASQAGARADSDDTVTPQSADPVPAKYRETPLEFAVPSGGTDKADFKLESSGGGATSQPGAGGPKPTDS